MDIDQQYAGDISKISAIIRAMEKVKDEVPVKLANRGLKINESKTGEYTIMVAHRSQSKNK